MKQAAATDQCAYIYIFGEQQSVLLPAHKEIFAFAREHMAAIATAELETVLASVFGEGQLFPGPDTALGALMHEYASRTAAQAVGVPAASVGQSSSYCLLILVFKGQEGAMRVRTAAQLPVDSNKNPLDSEEQAYQLVVEKLPGFQHLFLEHPCAPQSRLIGLLKAAALVHINRQLD